MYTSNYSLTNMVQYAPKISYCASCASSSNDYICNQGLETKIIENNHPSPLNDIINNSVIDNYTSTYTNDKQYTTTSNNSYYFSPDPFLNPNRPRERFTGKAEDIKHYIKDAFEKTTNNALPDDIDIIICSEKEFKENTKIEDPGVRGVTLNRRHLGQITNIIIKEDEFAKIMLTIGHELGHAISLPLVDDINEEAKAFAFQVAFMHSLHEYNVANMRNCINLDFNPATNGIHNVAFNHVSRLITNGTKPLEIFRGIVQKQITFQ